MHIVTDWFVSIFKIFFFPTEKTFLEEAQKADGKFWGAVVWLVLLTLFGVWFLVFNFGATYNPFAILAIILLLPIIFLFYVFCIHLIYQRFFHRKKYVYNEILYLMVCIIAPITVVNSYAGLIPNFGTTASWVTILYGAFLVIAAIRAVCKLTIPQSIAVFVFATILGGVGFFCIPTFFMGLLGSVPGMF